jgi:hypothetical protein
MEDDVSGWSCFGVDVYVGVEELENFKHQIAELESVVLVQIHQRYFGLEGRFVEQ